MTRPDVESKDTMGALALDWLICRSVLSRPLRNRLHPGPRCLTIVAFEGPVSLPLTCPHCGSRVA